MNANFASWHDRDMRELAAELIGKGAGWRTLMRELAIPMTTAKNWVKSCRAVGSEVFLNMGSSHRSYGSHNRSSFNGAIVTPFAASRCRKRGQSKIPKVDFAVLRARF